MVTGLRTKPSDVVVWIGRGSRRNNYSSSCRTLATQVKWIGSVWHQRRVHLIYTPASSIAARAAFWHRCSTWNTYP